MALRSKLCALAQGAFSRKRPIPSPRSSKPSLAKAATSIGGLAIAAFSALLASTSPGRAIMIYNFIEHPGNTVTLRASGSLNLPNPTAIADLNCSMDGYAAVGYMLILCTGPDQLLDTYKVSGPQFFPFDGGGKAASSAAGISTIYDGGGNGFAIGPYVSGDDIMSQATFTNTTLADFGLDGISGLYATWTLQPADENDPYTANDTIQLFVTPVPAPLPLLGAGSAYAFSRRLRRRIAAARASSSQG